MGFGHRPDIGHRTREDRKNHTRVGHHLRGVLAPARRIQRRDQKIGAAGSGVDGGSGAPNAKRHTVFFRRYAFYGCRRRERRPDRRQSRQPVSEEEVPRLRHEDARAILGIVTRFKEPSSAMSVLATVSDTVTIFKAILEGLKDDGE